MAFRRLGLRPLAIAPPKADLIPTRSPRDPLDQRRTSALPYPWPPLLFIAVIVGGRMLDHWLPTPWIPPGPAHFAGTVLIVLGLANDVWCALTLSRHNTTILPHRAVTALVTSGPTAILATRFTFPSW